MYIKRIDYVSDPDQDGALWYVDGLYVGHDDQWDPTLAMTRDEEVFASLCKRSLLADVEIFDLYGIEKLWDLEKYLVPLVNV